MSVSRCIPIQEEECWGHKGSLQGQTLPGNITFQLFLLLLLYLKIGVAQMQAKCYVVQYAFPEGTIPSN